MKKYNNFELLLHAAAEECVEEEAKEFLTQDTSKVEGKIINQKRVEKLIKKSCRFHQKNYRIRTLLAIAALLIVILVSTACLSFTEIGQKAYNAVVGFFDKYISIDFEESPREDLSSEETETVVESETLPPSAELPSSIERKIYASYLPSTYNCTIDGESEFYYLLSYYDLSNNWAFSVTQSTITNHSHFSDYEKQATEFINIRGNRAIVIKDETQTDFYTLHWRDLGYEYSIYGNFKDINTLKKIAEGITLE
ncbi:MAG: DUF4367 domain-containing protein [Paludibacteraceae bacterium]|nr:DUF4367 domain-containing protein [Paludibacteraceae bacterium]